MSILKYIFVYAGNATFEREHLATVDAQELQWHPNAGLCLNSFRALFERLELECSSLQDHDSFWLVFATPTGRPLGYMTCGAQSSKEAIAHGANWARCGDRNIVESDYVAATPVPEITISAQSVHRFEAA